MYIYTGCGIDIIDTYATQVAQISIAGGESRKIGYELRRFKYTMGGIVYNKHRDVKKDLFFSLSSLIISKYICITWKI